MQSLDKTRSKLKGTVVSIQNAGSLETTSLLTFGTVAVVYGMGIYYGLPYALLQENLALLLDIFFLVLLGMIFGLTMLSSVF